MLIICVVATNKNKPYRVRSGLHRVYETIGGCFKLTKHTANESFVHTSHHSHSVTVFRTVGKSRVRIIIRLVDIKAARNLFWLHLTKWIKMSAICITAISIKGLHLKMQSINQTKYVAYGLLAMKASGEWDIIQYTAVTPLCCCPTPKVGCVRSGQVVSLSGHFGSSWFYWTLYSNEKYKVIFYRRRKSLWISIVNLNFRWLLVMINKKTRDIIQ